MTRAADQFESVLSKARNIVLQELITQTVVYLRKFVDRIPKYVDRDDLIAGAAANFANSVTFMCGAVPLVPAPSSSDVVWSSTVSDPTRLEIFMTVTDPICEEFERLTDRQQTLIEGWTVTDASIPADKWSAEQRALNTAVQEVLIHDLPDFRRLAEKAKGRIVGDLLATQNAYTQAFAHVIPSYVPEDIDLWSAAVSLAGGVAAACKAAT